MYDDENQSDIDASLVAVSVHLIGKPARRQPKAVDVISKIMEDHAKRASARRLP
jgi:hypothetical protein